MKKDNTIDRRKFLNFTTLSVAATSVALLTGNSTAHAQATSFFTALGSDTKNDTSLGEIKHIKAGVLSIGYAELGPSNGTPVILLHGWPYDIHSYADVAPILAKQGMRVIVPHLRGHGSTTFLDPKTSRSGQQAAIGDDVIELMNALKINKAVLAGYDWGGRAACVAAALWPERCLALVSVNSYLIQDISKASEPISPKTEAGFWYQFYFLTERGRKGLNLNRKEIANVMWTRNSPKWHFSENEFERSAANFNNPDYVEIVLHSYRHRLGSATGYPEYEEMEKKLSLQPNITVPSITLDGNDDGVVAPTDGKSSAPKFTGFREHRIVSNAGHNLPQENPKAFAKAVIDVLKMATQ